MIATKAQELEALKKIQKIVEELGTDSYLSITFEGCFEQAKENIENDWGNNYKAMYDLSNKDLCDVRIAFQEVEANNRELESKNENLKSELDKAKDEIENWKNEYHSINDTADKWAEEANEADEKVKKLTQEITELKAKLYDLMTK